MDERSRHVEFDACFNFRDLGGYETADGARVRWRVLYRADTLHRLTERDAERFAELGLRTVIDLRSGAEIDDHGRLGVTSGDLAWHNVAMSDDLKLAPGGEPPPPPPVPPRRAPRDPGGVYLDIAERFRTSIGDVLTLLAAEDGLPAVFHCTGGKDRTGIIAALVLDILGVPDDVIAADYVLTARARERSTPWIEANEPVFAAFLAQIPPERRTIRPETILGFLAGIRAQHGSGAEFLVACGLSDTQLANLRDRLLER
jgi:protein-tyrosine phosphatase